MADSPVTAANPADHPHTDPGDGRSECDRCGKWVFPAIHSCKGVPVTAAARARFAARQPVSNADEFAPDPADPAWDAAVDAAAAVIYGEGMGGEGVVAEALTAALGKLGGRLLPPDTDTRPDGWAVRVTLKTGAVSVRHSDDPLMNREIAEQVADYARRHPAVVAAEVVTRSEWVGPWVSVPTGEQAKQDARNALGGSSSQSPDELRKHLGEPTASKPPVPTAPADLPNSPPDPPNRGRRPSVPTTKETP